MTTNCGIYVIINTRNGKCYFGQSIYTDVRLKQHFKSLSKNSHQNKVIQRAYNKEQDRTVFVGRHFISCIESDLTKTEQLCFDVFKPEYNMSLTAGRVDYTPEIRKSMGRQGPDHHMYGKNHRPESIAKNRAAHPSEKGTNTKLKENQVKEIILSDKTAKELSEIYGVNGGTISSIRSGKTWKHLERPLIKPYSLGCPGERNGMYGKPHAPESIFKMSENRSKLSKEQVIEILSSSESHSKIAKRFGAPYETVRLIRVGKTWKHIERPAEKPWEKK